VHFRKTRGAANGTGSNQAHSIKTFFVETKFSVTAPPMDSADATAREPSPSLIMQMFE